MVVDFAIDGTAESCYIRLFTPPIDLPFTLPERYQLALGRGVRLTEGRDAVLFAYGPMMLAQAVEASRSLSEQGVGLSVVNLPWLNRIDRDWLQSTVDGVEAVVTLDDHYVDGGQGDMVLSALASLDAPYPGRARKLGVTDVPRCGTNDEVLAAHGLDARSIADAVLGLVRAPAGTAG